MRSHNNDRIPSLTIQDVPSEGRAIVGVGWTTGRRHELLSDIERDYCYLMDYSEEVTDIRQEFPPLPLEETQMIAEKLGIQHPADPKTGVAQVLRVPLGQIENRLPPIYVIIKILRPDQQSSIKIEHNIKLLLGGLVQKGGHWDQYVLDRCRDMNIEKVKHYLSDNTRDWAFRIIEKLFKY